MMVLTIKYSHNLKAITVGGGNIHWITVLGALIHIWRPEVTHGCDIFCLLKWPEIFSFYNGKQMTIISQYIN